MTSQKLIRSLMLGPASYFLLLPFDRKMVFLHSLHSNLFLKIILFICVHVWRGTLYDYNAHEGKKRDLDSFQLKLQVIVSMARIQKKKKKKNPVILCFVIEKKILLIMKPFIQLLCFKCNFPPSWSTTGLIFCHRHGLDEVAIVTD